MKILWLLLSLTLLTIFTASAQTDTTNSGNDTTDVENWDSWGPSRSYDFNIDLLGDELRGSPTIYLSYGMAKLEHRDFSYGFSEPRSLELKLGKTFQRPYKDESGILRYRMHYIFLNNVTSELAEQENTKIETESWRFGFGRSTGFGYKIGPAAIIPYNTNAFTWTRLKAAMPVIDIDIPGREILDRYDQAFRFGNTTEAGIKIQFIPAISLDASYERTAVYERHLFWKWGGSFLIEVIGQSLVDEFVNEIMKSSPYAGPIINFLLKNGLSYGMYELRKEKMNWPFNSTPSLMYEQVKVGMTFVF